MDVRLGLWKRLSAKELMLLNCGVGEDSWESLGLQGDPTSQSYRKAALNIHWKDWWWSWNSNTLATWCKELTPWKRPWYWERLKVGGERDDRGWDGWMASPTQWASVWVKSGSWDREAWHATVHGVAKSWTRLSHWATELNVSLYICTTASLSAHLSMDSICMKISRALRALNVFIQLFQHYVPK